MGYHHSKVHGVQDKKLKRITELATWSEFKMQIVKQKNLCPYLVGGETGRGKDLFTVPCT